MRFHSPDPWSPFTTGEINPYTYCLSDPVNRVDPSGHFSLFGVKFGWKELIGAVFSFIASIAVGVLTGGASLAVQIGAGALVGGVTSAASEAIGELAEGRTPTWSSIGVSFGTRILTGALGAAAGAGLRAGATTYKTALGRAGSMSAARLSTIQCSDWVCAKIWRMDSVPLSRKAPSRLLWDW